MLKKVGMLDNNNKITPAPTMSLGTYTDGPPFDEPWENDSVVGMFMYLSSNYRPDIQFSVYQGARFTHNPMRIHDESVKRICHYLVGTQCKGLDFDPNSDMNLDFYVDAIFQDFVNTRMTNILCV